MFLLANPLQRLRPRLKRLLGGSMPGMSQTRAQPRSGARSGRPPDSGVRPVQVSAMAEYRPSQTVTAEQIETRLDCAPGWSAKRTGVRSRRFVNAETVAQMGATVARAALDKAGLAFEDIDLLVSASATKEQLLPCTASFIQQAMGKGDSGVPSFDVDSTCLSFLVALDTLSYAIMAGRYRRVLVVSAEIPSHSLDYNHKESAALFGDGAVAAVLERTPDVESSGILAAHMETYGNAAHWCEVRAGATRHPAQSGMDVDDFLFKMDGQRIYRAASEKLPTFVERLFAGTGKSLQDVDLVIPHQASLMALKLTRRRLGIPEDKFFVYLEDTGNTVAASLPIGLHRAVQAGHIERGSLVLLMGTSAGLSIGATLLRY